MVPYYLQHKVHVHYITRGTHDLMYFSCFLLHLVEDILAIPHVFPSLRGSPCPGMLAHASASDQGSLSTHAVIPSLPGQLLLSCQGPQIPTSFYMCLFTD